MKALVCIMLIASVLIVRADYLTFISDNVKQSCNAPESKPENQKEAEKVAFCIMTATKAMNGLGKVDEKKLKDLIASKETDEDKVQDIFDECGNEGNPQEPKERACLILDCLDEQSAKKGDEKK